MAFPLLAGPGAITSVILSFQTAGLAVTMLSIAIVIGVTYVVFYLTGPIYRILGRRGSLIITRVFAVLVASYCSSICGGWPEDNLDSIINCYYVV